MPWKERYTISDEKSLADDDIRWPQGARCCVGVTVDLSVAAGADGIRAADLRTPEAEFGAYQGLAARMPFGHVRLLARGRLWDIGARSPRAA